MLFWLREEAGNFGFVEVYTADTLRSGYQPEAWHWSYLPLAGPLFEAINDAVTEGTLPRFEGFEGAELADPLRIIEDFVNGINRARFDPGHFSNDQIGTSSPSTTLPTLTTPG